MYRREMVKAANDKEEVVEAFNEYQLSFKMDKSNEAYETDIIKQVINMHNGKENTIATKMTELQELQQRLEMQREAAKIKTPTSNKSSHGLSQLN